MKLIEILDKEKKVFVDTSAKVPDNESSFLFEIYDSTSYNQLDMKSLQNYLDKINEVLVFLKEGERKRNLFSIPESVEELNDLYKAVISKQEFLGNKKLSFNHKIKNTYVREKKFSPKSEIVETFSEIRLKIREMLKITRQLQYKFDSSLYDPLVRLFLTIGYYVLQDKSSNWKFEKYGEPVSIIFEEKTHTDEKLIAAAVYSSLFDEGESSIVTRDTDFINLLREGISLICERDAKGNKCLADCLVKNPVKLYFPSEGNNCYNLILTTADIKNHSGGASWQIKQQTKDLLDEIESKLIIC